MTLLSLRRAAQAMDCQLVYFLVPDQGSFETLLESRIRAVAKEELERLKQTMALEAQGVGVDEEEELLSRLIGEMTRNPSGLWK